ASALGALLFAIERGRASANERSEARCGTEAGVAEARALVAVLETRLRSVEANLKKARELLAQLEGSGKPAPGKDEKEKSEADDKRLEGVWRIVSIGGNFGSEFRKPPYDEYKIM